MRKCSIYLLLVIAVFHSMLPALPAEAVKFTSGPDDGLRYIVFGEFDGDFYGDGSSVKVEIIGTTPSDTVNEDDAEDDYPAVAYMLRATPEGSSSFEEHVLEYTVGSPFRFSKQCDIDGDGIPEIFFVHHPGGTVQGVEITVISLKGGRFRGIFTWEDFYPPNFYAETEPGFKIRMSALR
jgi:hypothetical protein